MGNALRNVIAGGIALVSALGIVACSGARESDVTSGESTGADQSLLKEGACLSEALGDGTTCKSYDDLKLAAYESCTSRGLELTDLSLGAACKTEKGIEGASEAKYACCKTGPKPVPKPEPIACFVDAQGGPTSCKPVDVWTKYASEVCGAKNAKITQIAFAEECAKESFRYVKYECCDGSKPPPPPPPPPACKTTELGDGKTCVANGTWKEKAYYLCTDAKMVLTSLSLGTPCDKDGSTAVKVECCTDDLKPPPTEPLPPKPQPSCTDTQEIGDLKTCNDPATWKKLAYESCLKQGLTLSDISYGGGVCGANGETHGAKFVCCK